MVVIYHKNSKNEIDRVLAFRENITPKEIDELEKINSSGIATGTLHWVEFNPGSIEEFLCRKWIECYVHNHESDIVRIMEGAICLEKNSLNMYKEMLFEQNKE